MEGRWGFVAEGCYYGDFFFSVEFFLRTFVKVKVIEKDISV